MKHKILVLPLLSDGNGTILPAPMPRIFELPGGVASHGAAK